MLLPRQWIGGGIRYATHFAIAPPRPRGQAAGSARSGLVRAAVWNGPTVSDSVSPRNLLVTPVWCAVRAGGDPGAGCTACVATLCPLATTP